MSTIENEIDYVQLNENLEKNDKNSNNCLKSVIIFLIILFLSSIILLIINFKIKLFTASLPVFIVFIICCGLLILRLII